MLELFDVYILFSDGTNMKEYCDLDAETAVKKAMGITTRPAAMIGIIDGVLIADKLDLTVFEWRAGKGVIFPPLEAPKG